MENHNQENEKDEVIIMTQVKSDLQNGQNKKQLPNENPTIIQIAHKKIKANSDTVKRILAVFIHIVVVGYLSYATYHFIYSENDSTSKIDKDTEKCYGKCGFQWCNGYGMLLILFSFTYFGLFYYFIFKPKIGIKLHENILKPFKHKLIQNLSNRLTYIILGLLITLVIGIFLYFETRGSLHRLTSLSAPVIFLFGGYIFSTDRNAIKWRPVILGVICQFLLGIICIRWEIGRNIFQCMGDKVATFLSYSREGSKFVFGHLAYTTEHNKEIFAFAILPVIFFFSFFISILYYFGTMQWIIVKLGWILQSILGTTVCESVNSAANIFLGMSESPLLIRPYIKHLTASEMHAVMVSGFATVSGTVLAAYMSFGAQPAHLITSSVMAAPATLAISKLYYPETEESKTKSDNIQLEKSKDGSLLDAASSGASAAIEIILGIIANIVAFVAFIAFLNGVVNWLGYLIGQDELTFEWLFAKIFIPVSWSLGIPWEECDIVAKVIATKTIINEFVAYERLGQYKDAGALSPRSTGITTFAICGFANPSSLGILIGSLGAMAPERRSLITSVAFRAFFVGTVVCFISASFAGLLMTEDIYNGFQNKTITNFYKNLTIS